MSVEGGTFTGIILEAKTLSEDEAVSLLAHYVNNMTPERQRDLIIENNLFSGTVLQLGHALGKHGIDPLVKAFDENVRGDFTDIFKAIGGWVALK